MKKTTSAGLSIIIPAYNAQDWLSPTTAKIDAAVAKIKHIKAELIIVDDGSSDDTLRVARSLKLPHISAIKVLTHPNQGRFLTRKRGVEVAEYDTVLFIDTRVWIDASGLKYVYDQLKKHPERVVWNGDVEVAKKGNVIARFQDAVTSIGWRRYHSNPRLLSYGIEDFDHYPKGTGIFFVPKQLLSEGMAWFEKTTTDIRNSSDDTLLIRYIAQRQRIWISPGFTSTYFARTTLKAFIKHTYYRGQFFVDGFLRPGTRFFYPLIVFLLITLLVPAGMIIFPGTIIYLLGAAMLVWLGELLIALLLWIPKKDALSLFLLTPIFALFYGLGIWRAVIRRYLKA